MGRILNAEIYRLRKQKSSFILLIILFAFTLISGLYMGLALGNAPWLIKIYEEVKEMYETYNMGQYYAQIEELRSSVQMHSYAEFVSLVMPAGLLAYMTFFLFLFHGRSRISRFTVNYFTNNTPTDYMAAQFVILLLYSLVGTIVSFAASLPGAYWFFSFENFGTLADCLLYFVTIWLLHTVAGMILLLFQLLARRVMIGVMFGFVYALFISDFIYRMLNQAIQYTTRREVFVQGFTIFGNIAFMNFGDPFSVGRALICVGGYGLLTFFLCSLVLHKTDKL